MIISRTPHRISFFGGGTDYPAWYRQHGGAVLAATIGSNSQLSRNRIHLETSCWTEEELSELNRAADTLPSFEQRTYAPVMRVHEAHPAFMTALRQPKILSIMEQLVSGQVSALQTEFFYCAPGTRGFAMHQDNSYVQANPAVFASAWSALDDVSPENGGLVLYPGTHREPILPFEPCPNHLRQDSQDPNANALQVVLPPGYAGVDVVVPKGAVVFLHAHVVHSSHDNRSNRFRRALLMTYIRQGEDFRPGAHARRTEINVYN